MRRGTNGLMVVLGMAVVLELSSAAGAAPPAVLFILDVSGSMAQKLGDRTKMQAAKDAFVPLLGDLNADLPVGLEVYGHRGDKDCSAIEMAQPIDPLDAATIRSRVSALEPHRGAKIGRAHV